MIGNLAAKRFFSAAEKERIINAIQSAERLTSGEIRVHVESAAGKKPLERAQVLFEQLGMSATELRNGVLVYLAVKDRQFAIIGDQGIDRVVPANFWDDTKEQMQQLFKEGKFVDGVCLGVHLVGEHLATHFPCQPGDVNELSNEISEGK